MDVYEAIVNRRSVRAYSDKSVDADTVRRICEAGLYAPSGNGLQSSLIVAVTDKEIRGQLSALNAAARGQEGDPFYGAPVVLVVLANRLVGTYLQDGSLTMATLMLAAYAEGVGSCWVHRAKEQFEGELGQKLYRKLGIPEGYEGVGNCILGYPTDGFPEADKRREGRLIMA